MLQANLLFGEGIDSMERSKDRTVSGDVSSALAHISMDVDLPKDDGFGSMAGGGLFEGGLFEDTPMPSVPNVDNEPVPEAMQIDLAVPSTSGEPMSRMNDDDDFDDNFGAPSPGGGRYEGFRILNVFLYRNYKGIFQLDWFSPSVSVGCVYGDGKQIRF